jgi:hypothetical protein
MKFQKIIGTVLVAAAATMALAGCEDPRTYRPVTATKLRTYNNQGDNYVELAVTLKTESVQLPQLEIPVTRPESNIEVATLSLRPSAQSGMSDLVVAVNVTNSAGLEGARPTLPNGTVIPVSGVDMNQLVALPLDQYNKGGRIYLAIDTANHTAIMGTALTWSALDSFGQTVGSLNFFPAFDVVKGVKGIAGIFGSKTPGANGVAVFADISQLLSKSNATQGFLNRPVGEVKFLQ